MTSFSQYFSVLPPINVATAEQTLANFNIYTIKQSVNVFLPTVRVARGEWVAVINVDNIPTSKIEDLEGGYIKPKVKVKEKDDSIAGAGALSTITYTEVELKAGSVTIFIKVTGFWFVTSFDLSLLTDEKIRTVSTTVNGLRINNASTALTITRINAAIASIQESLISQTYTWLYRRDFSFLTYMYNQNIPLDRAEYWSFDFSEYIPGQPVPTYPRPALFNAYKIIRITNNNNTQNPLFYLAKPSNTTQETHTLAGGDILKTTSGDQFHRIRQAGLYRVSYNPNTRIYTLEAFDSANLPAPETIKQITLDNRAAIAQWQENPVIEIPYGSEFPTAPPETNIFRIDSGSAYPLGVYIYDESLKAWIAQF